MRVRRSSKLLFILVACVSFIKLADFANVMAAEPVVQVIVGSELPDPSQDASVLTSQGPLNTPFAVCFEPDGAMWIVEYDGGRLWKRLADGTLVHVAGDGQLGYADGSAKAARFNKLHNVIRLADGRLLMSDHRNHAIRCYDPKTDLVSTYAGSGDSGFSGDGDLVAGARFDEPICIERSKDYATLLIADIRNNRIRIVNVASGTIETLAGTGKRARSTEGGIAKNEPLFDPRAAITDDQGGYYVLERSGNRLLSIDSSGVIRTVAGSGETGLIDGPALEACMNGPKHMCLGPNGVVFIADDNNDVVRKYDPAAKTLTTVDLGAYKLDRPHGVAVWDGWLYVADSYHHRILRVPL